jgi:dTDP-4-dehydrorhamnose reductase
MPLMATTSTETRPHNIVLTGASGYLGQHILHRLVTNPPPGDLEHVHIYALYGSKEGFPEAVMQLDSTKAITVESLDLSNAQAVTVWTRDHPGMDVCIHTAALSSPRVCENEKEKARNLNVPHHFFQQLEAGNCRIIALSTDQVYEGTAPPYVETDFAKPVNVYGTTKLAMEDSLSTCTDAVVLRSSIILGPKAPLAPAHDTFLHFCASREGKPTDFYTDECRSVIFVKDAVETVLWFAQASLGESAHDAIHRRRVYNMGGPVSVSRVDLARAVFDHLAYNDECIQAKEKAKLPAGPVASPLDISMNSSRLTSLMNRSFASLEEMIQATFPR